MLDMVRHRAPFYRARYFSFVCCYATLIGGCALNSSPAHTAGVARIGAQNDVLVTAVANSPLAKVTGQTWKVDPSGGICGGRDLWSVSLNASGDVGFAVGNGGVVLRWDGRAWKGDAVAMRTANGADFHAVAVDAFGKRALAVGAAGLIMSWDGKSWKHEPVAEKLAIRRNLVAVSFDKKGSIAWVVGQYGMALHWNGLKWTRTPTPFSVPGFAEGGAPVDTFGMWAVWAGPNGVDALASGNGDRILRWDGHVWKDDKQVANLRLTRDAFSGVNSIAMSKDGKNGWMVGGESDLTWSGSEWHRHPSSVGSPNDDLDLTCVDCNATGTTAFAVGPKGTVGRWDGKKWAIDASGQAAAGGKHLSGIALNGSGNVGFAVGQEGFILRWDGKAWKRDPAGERASYGQFSSVAMSADGKSGLAVCFRGDPLRWDAAAWKADTSRHSSYMRLNALWLAPSGDKAFGAGEDGIYRWNGSDWTAEPSGRSLHGLALTSNGQLGFAGSITGTIYRYDGSRWAEDKRGTRESGGAALYSMCLSSDGKVGFAAGSDVFLRWDGSAWHKDAKLSKRSYNYICLNAKGDFGFASGSSPAGDTIMRWDGKAWHTDRQANEVFTDTALFCLALSADGRTGIAVTFQGPVFRWDGVKWRRDALATKLAQGQRLVSACLDPAGRSGWVLGWHGFLMRYLATDAPKGFRK